MARGTSTGGDVVKTTIDGVSVADLFREFAETLRIRNQAQDDLRAFLTFGTTAVGDHVAQTLETEDMEEASEWGVPKGIRAPGTYLTLGYGFSWWDAAARYTWKFLVDADRSQVEAGVGPLAWTPRCCGLRLRLQW